MHSRIHLGKRHDIRDQFVHVDNLSGAGTLSYKPSQVADHVARTLRLPADLVHCSQ